MCLLQDLSERVAGKEAEITEREYSRRMLEECIAHQKALQGEKQLVARMEEVRTCLDFLLGAAHSTSQTYFVRT